jgi:hypothetical protein
VFFNVQGREPRGVIPPGDYESFRDEIKSRFEALTDDAGRPLNSPVFKPKEIYRRVRNVPPDLIVHFGGLRWRSIGSVGYGKLHVQENDTGPDACNHAQFGMFVLAAPNWPEPASSGAQPKMAVPWPEAASSDAQPGVAVPRGEYRGAHLLDVAPTLLDLAGYPVPPTMQGRSWLTTVPSG